jgi:hypothetical protein
MSEPAVQERRHPDLWFADGSVILRARDGMLFRVHMSQLARRSPFFHDMFALPQPSDMMPENEENDKEKIEGCPVVQLHDDSEDIVSLLTAVYDGP